MLTRYFFKRVSSIVNVFMRGGRRDSFDVGEWTFEFDRASVSLSISVGPAHA